MCVRVRACVWSMSMTHGERESFIVIPSPNTQTPKPNVLIFSVCWATCVEVKVIPADPAPAL